MTQDEYNAFCETLPHTLHVVQWGGADVWKVGSPEKNKLFAVGGWRSPERKRGKGAQENKKGSSALQEARSGIAATGIKEMRRTRVGVERSETAVSDIKQAYGITFKTGEIAFEMLRDAPGCQPAPYLASRGMKWIMRTGADTISDTDMQDYLRESHRLASLNLTKKLQKELGLNQGAGV